MTFLDKLQKFTTIVADSGDYESIESYKTTDATTNPSLIALAAIMEKYKDILNRAVDYGIKSGKTENEMVTDATDMVGVLFGCEILKVIPGRVSTAIDARLSFDTNRSVEKALKLIKYYDELHAAKERVLIKLPATWEGIKAAKILEEEHGIHCNVTLILSFYQAVACAEAKVTMISPFVGRIFDWYVKQAGTNVYKGDDDPGVLSVKRIYNYYKKFNYKTQIMAESFRNMDQVKSLAGCDLVTINLKLLGELSKRYDDITRRLNPAAAKMINIEEVHVDEPKFRYVINEDVMASDKLYESIRKFCADTRFLEDIIRKEIRKNLSTDTRSTVKNTNKLR